MLLKAAETADAIVRTALTLFGGDLFYDPAYPGSLSFTGQPYPIPGTEQLRLTGAETGIGNALPDPDAFSADTRLWSACHPGQQMPERAKDARLYSFACRPCDRVYAAVQVLFALYIQRDVRKFIVAARNIVEREQIRQAMEVYTTHFAEQYRRMAPVIRVYDSADRDGLRNYVCGEGIQILLINRENFDRDANLLRRPSAYFSGQTPLSLLAPARPVVITLSADAGPLLRFFAHTALFTPLCTLAFTETPDESGITFPLYTGVPQTFPEEPDGQLRLDE